MADNAIASGSAILTANADGLAHGLDRAANMVQGWGVKVGGILASIGTGGTLAGLAIIGSTIKTVFDAATSPLDTIFDLAKIDKQAHALAVSASQFQGLEKVMHKAGIEGDSVAQVFSVMGEKISDVASGFGRGASRAFEKLGLDANELMEMKPDQQFMAIADAFKAMGPGAEASAAAVHLFGGNAAGLLPELLKGSEGVQGFIDKMKATGAVLSNDQLAAAGRAAKAWKTAKFEIGAAWEGLTNRISVAMAPVVESIGHSASSIVEKLQPVFDWLARGWDKVGNIISYAFDAAVESLRGLTDMAGALVGKLDKVPGVGDLIVDAMRLVGVTAADAWDTFKVGLAKVIEHTGTLIEGMGKVVTAGAKIMAIQALINPLVSKESAIKAVGFALDAMAVEESGRKMKEFGKKLGIEAAAGFGESGAKFLAFMDKAAKGKGSFDGGWLTSSGRTVHGAIGDEPKIWDPAKLAGAFDQTSKEAYSLIMKNTYGDFKGMDDVNKKNGEKLDKANVMLGTINKSLEILTGQIEAV